MDIFKRLLNVELPDGITRVSEYVDEIILFITLLVVFLE